MSNLMKNPSSGSRVVPCGRTEEQTDRRQDMTRLIVAFRNFAEAATNVYGTIYNADSVFEFEFQVMLVYYKIC